MAKKKAKETVSRTTDLLGAIVGEKPVSETPAESAKKNPLFEIIDAIFRNPAYIASLTEQQASQNIFMVLRRLAINHPIQANVFNNSSVNALDVLKFWSSYLYCGRVPKWAYTSTKGTAKKKDNAQITKGDIEAYISFHDIDRKSFESAMRIFPDETVAEVIEHKNYIKSISDGRLGNECDD